MKISTVVPTTNVKRFQHDFMKSSGIIFRDMESECTYEGSKIVCKLGGKESPTLDKEITIDFAPVVGEKYSRITFTVIPSFGFRNMIDPSKAIAIWLHNNYQCIEFSDVTRGGDYNILGINTNQLHLAKERASRSGLMEVN